MYAVCTAYLGVTTADIRIRTANTAVGSLFWGLIEMALPLCRIGFSKELNIDIK